MIELKVIDFKPEHLGQLSFYLSAVDAQIKTPEDAPTIGPSHASWCLAFPASARIGCSLAPSA